MPLIEELTLTCPKRGLAITVALTSLHENARLFCTNCPDGWRVDKDRGQGLLTRLEWSQYRTGSGARRRRGHSLRPLGSIGLSRVACSLNHGDGHLSGKPSRNSGATCPHQSKPPGKDGCRAKFPFREALARKAREPAAEGDREIDLAASDELRQPVRRPNRTKVGA